MSADVLLAQELRDLLDPALLSDYELEWLRPEDRIPSGAYRAFVPTLSRRVEAEAFRRLGDLRIVANSAVGVDNIDLEAASASGVIVTNTPGVLTESTADLTWALILASARRLKEGQEILRTRSWTGWHPALLLGMELNGRTLGIIGAGRIGQAVGRRAIGFGMNILYTSPSPKPVFEEVTHARRVSLDQLLGESDVVTLHAPLTSETEHLLDETRLRQMKMGATLVNTARGGMVDELAMLNALDDGRLRGAGLDVFEGEPAVNSDLIAHPQVVCLPHLGSATWETRSAMANLAARNVDAVLSGAPPLTPVVVDHAAEPS